MVMPYHLHMPSYFLETFTEYPNLKLKKFREQNFGNNGFSKADHPRRVYDEFIKEDFIPEDDRA